SRCFTGFDVHQRPQPGREAQARQAPPPPTKERTQMNHRRKALFALALLAALGGATIANAEFVQKGTLRVEITGDLAPKTLPRSGSAPISVSVGGQITTTDKSPPPRLTSIDIELNRAGRIDSTGLPICGYHSIQPASTSRALSACRPALVGEGSFSAEIT